jgi:mediator of RNA polymerase II transcription subunit 10
VVGYLGGLDNMASHLTTRVPMQILTDIDNGRNPMHLTKDRLERAATENQFMNGKIKAIEVCLRPACSRRFLTSAL